MLVLGAIFVLGVGGAWAFDNFGGGGYIDVAIVHESSAFIIDEEMLDLPHVNFEIVDDLEGARVDLDAGVWDYIFVISGETRPELETISHSFADFEVEMFLTSILTNMHLATIIEAYDVPIEAVQDILQPIEVTAETVLSEEELVQGMVVGPTFSWVLYMVLAISGQMIATGIANEKTSRVMEIMIAKIKPGHMMVAKITSNLCSILLLIVPVIAAAFLSEILGFIELDSIREFLSEFVSMEVVMLGIVFMILGYFLYAVLFATAGAITTSIESLGTVTAPLIYAILIPLLLPMFIDLDTVLMTVLSYIPLFSPFITLSRFTSGYANTVEVGASIVILIVSTIILFKLAERIFTNAVSHHSDKKLTFKDFKKLMQR